MVRRSNSRMRKRRRWRGVWRPRRPVRRRVQRWSSTQPSPSSSSPGFAARDPRIGRGSRPERVRRARTASRTEDSPLPGTKASRSSLPKRQRAETPSSRRTRTSPMCPSVHASATSRRRSPKTSASSPFREDSGSSQRATAASSHCTGPSVFAVIRPRRVRDRDRRPVVGVAYCCGSASGGRLVAPLLRMTRACNNIAPSTYESRRRQERLSGGARGAGHGGAQALRRKGPRSPPRGRVSRPSRRKRRRSARSTRRPAG